MLLSWLLLLELVLEADLLVGLLSYGTSAEALCWRLVRCFAHIVDIFEHKLGLFWHSHGAVMHLLHW